MFNSMLLGHPCIIHAKSMQIIGHDHVTEALNSLEKDCKSLAVRTSSGRVLHNINDTPGPAKICIYLS